jgi:hypothetical protein
MMGINEDIKTMQELGRSELEIRSELKMRGVGDRELEDSLSQSQIKNAVTKQDDSQMMPSMGSGSGQADFSGYSEQQGGSGQQQEYTGAGTQEVGYNTSVQMSPMSQEYSGQGNGRGMEQSFTGQQSIQGGSVQPQSQQELAAYSGYGGAQDYAGFYPGQYQTQGNGGEYQPYEGGMSSDIINEIAEQVVNERLAGLQDKLEKAIDFRTVAVAKMESLGERVARIEQIIDRLQLSVLQKFGEYINDVDDVKKELGETQKSFKALLPGMKKSGTPDVQKESKPMIQKIEKFEPSEFLGNEIP